MKPDLVTGELSWFSSDRAWFLKDHNDLIMRSFLLLCSLKSALVGLCKGEAPEQGEKKKERKKQASFELLARKLKNLRIIFYTFKKDFWDTVNRVKIKKMSLVTNVYNY